MAERKSVTKSMSDLQPAHHLAQRLLEVYRAMESGDPESVEALYSLDPGGVFIGSSAAEFWTDSAQHNADVCEDLQPG